MFVSCATTGTAILKFGRIAHLLGRQSPGARRTVGSVCRRCPAGPLSSIDLNIGPRDLGITRERSRRSPMMRFITWRRGEEDARRPHARRPDRTARGQLRREVRGRRSHPRRATLREDHPPPALRPLRRGRHAGAHPLGIPGGIVLERADLGRRWPLTSIIPSRGPAARSPVRARRRCIVEHLRGLGALGHRLHCLGRWAEIAL